MRTKGFANFEPGTYYQNMDATSVSSTTAERAQTHSTAVLAPSSSVSNHASTLTGLNKFLVDPRQSIFLYMLSKKLDTRMARQKEPVRTIEDARTRLLQTRGEGIAETFEVLAAACEHGLIDGETYRLMAQAGMELRPRVPQADPRDVQQNVRAILDRIDAVMRQHLERRPVVVTDRLF